jgi:glycosyltransferase involved in cell wall biosynthesis
MRMLRSISNQVSFNNGKRPVHIWIPEIFANKGGIQTYSAFFLQALQDLYPRVPYHVFLKNDVYGSAEAVGDSITKFSFAGSWPKELRTLYFALLAVGQGLMERPGIIISTHAHFSTLACYLKKVARIPYWVVAHGIDVWGLTNPALKKALREADLILSVSAYTRDRLLSEQQFDPEKVVILPGTMDSVRFNIESKPEYLMRRYGITRRQPVILTVSRLASRERYKGYDTILRALPVVRRAIPDVHYLIVGKGDDRPRIERIIAELGLNGCVTFAGYITDEELSDHYNLCDVFAMPSKGEGFGVVFLEAMACGKPVLAGNKDGSVDALRRGDLGVLVDPDNVREIASALIGMLNSTYSHPVIYDPQLLRRSVIGAYGFESFKLTLSTLLQTRLTFDLHSNSSP